MTRLWHPKHGYRMLEYGDDRAALEAAGWRPEQPPAAPASPPPQPAPPPRHDGQAWQRRRGR